MTATALTLIPVACPVSVFHLTAPRDSHGNPQEVFLVFAACGHVERPDELDHLTSAQLEALVEVIDIGYTGRIMLTMRWPWFNPAFHGREPRRGGLRGRRERKAEISREQYERWIDAELSARTHDLRDMADAIKAYGWCTEVIA